MLIKIRKLGPTFKMPIVGNGVLTFGNIELLRVADEQREQAEQIVAVFDPDGIMGLVNNLLIGVLDSLAFDADLSGDHKVLNGLWVSRAVHEKLHRAVSA